MKFKQLLKESHGTYYVLIYEDFTKPATSSAHIMCQGIVWFSSDEERKEAIIYREFGNESAVQMLYDDYDLKIKHFTEMTTQEFISAILSKKEKYAEFMTDHPSLPNKTASYVAVDIKHGESV